MFGKKYQKFDKISKNLEKKSKTFQRKNRLLQLVNLLRLHLVLRFHIFLAVLAPVIAGHLSGMYFHHGQNIATFQTHQVRWLLAGKGGEIVRRCDHYCLTRCWLLLWVKTRSGLLLSPLLS